MRQPGRPRMLEPNQVINIRLAKKEIAKVDHMATSKMTSRSTVLREIIENQLNNMNHA